MTSSNPRHALRGSMLCQRKFPMRPTTAPCIAPADQLKTRSTIPRTAPTAPKGAAVRLPCLHARAQHPSPWAFRSLSAPNLCSRMLPCNGTVSACALRNAAPRPSLLDDRSLSTVHHVSRVAAGSIIIMPAQARGLRGRVTVR